MASDTVKGPCNRGGLYFWHRESIRIATIASVHPLCPPLRNKQMDTFVSRLETQEKYEDGMAISAHFCST